MVCARSTGICFSLLALATGCGGPTLIRESSGNYRVEGAAYQIAPLAGGGLLPAGWEILGYEEKGGQLRRTGYSDCELRARRITDDATLTLCTESGWEVPKAFPEYVQRREHGQLVEAFGSQLIDHGGVKVHDYARATLSMQGGEAMEGKAEIAAPEPETVIFQSYRVWFRSSARSDAVTTLHYYGPPRSILSGRADVAKLMERISFQ